MEAQLTVVLIVSKIFELFLVQIRDLRSPNIEMMPVKASPDFDGTQDKLQEASPNSDLAYVHFNGSETLAMFI